MIHAFLVRPSRASAAGLLSLLALALATSACGGGPKTPMDVQNERMLRSEALLLAWNKTHYLSKLGKSAMNLEVPSPLSRSYFEDEVRFSGLVEEFPEPTQRLHEDTIRLYAWDVDDAESTLPAEELDFYGSLFDQVDYFKKAKFKIHLPVPQWVDPEEMTEWKVSLKFVAKARMKNGRLGAVSGFSDVYWRLQPESRGERNPEKQVWKIYRWNCRSLKLQESVGTLFEEVLAEAVPNPSAYEAARRSIHMEMVRDFLDPDVHMERPHPTWQLASGERHPTVEVCDLDEDGFDDFYVQERRGRNLFFRNRGDGTFEEIAGDLGLDFDGDTSSTAFADFDNDGDLDAFVGGSLERSRYLENVDGRFVDRSGELVPEDALPYHVSSLNAVDYDGDGLLDVYCSTYGAFFVQRGIVAMQGKNKRAAEMKAQNFLRDYLPEEDFEKLYAMMEEKAKIYGLHTDRPGPPNVLLRNLGGGRFEVAEDAQNLRIFYNTFQTTWADVDDDGDPDLYCANDFGPNFLFRNDGGGEFTDVTDLAQVEDVGFGMGVTWGDVDNDGTQDLYVTNMFSKAARRVTSFFTKGYENYDEALLGEDGGIDPIYRQLGAGNSMFRNPGTTEQKWEKISGMEKPKLVVEPGGWAWGAQFADFDNDGWVDIYNPSGYYTAPEEVKIDVDL